AAAFDAWSRRLVVAFIRINSMATRRSFPAPFLQKHATILPCRKAKPEKDAPV
ncbi:hypothetical protein NPIL_398201, partial [Nephila pilipes]